MMSLRMEKLQKMVSRENGPMVKLAMHASNSFLQARDDEKSIV